MYSCVVCSCYSYRTVAPEWALDCLGTTVGKVVLAGPRALPSPPCVFVLCSFKPFWWFSCCHSDTKHLSLDCLGTTVGKDLLLPAVIHLILANNQLERGVSGTN